MDNSMKQRYTERLLRHLLPIIFVLSLFLIHTVSGSAAGKATVDELAELPLEELMRVKVLKVYGVSRYEQSALEAPANVSIITADAIRRYGYRTLSDILRGATGLYVTNDRNYEYLGYRGFSLPGDYNTRALIMVDGVRLNDAVMKACVPEAAAQRR